MQKEILEKLASERNDPCVTITLNTHRTYPGNEHDRVGFKTMIEETEERVMSEYGKRSVSELLEKIQDVEREIDVNDNLDSLHIFLSNSTKKIIRSPLPALPDNVHIGERFAVDALMKDFSHIDEYLILLLSQKGTRLVAAMNDAVLQEINNDDFPLMESIQSVQADNFTPEFLQKTDKVIGQVHSETGMKCVVICNEANYNRLLEVAETPAIYYGQVHLMNADPANHAIAAGAWQIIKAFTGKKDAGAATIREVDDKLIGDDLAINDALEQGSGPVESRSPENGKNNY